LKYTGHPKTGDPYFVAVPFIGVEQGKKGGTNIHPLVADKSVVLAESMQSAREDFANQVVENKDPSEIDRFWFAPIIW